MHLEEQKLEQVLSDAELIVSCYTIIESAVTCLANERVIKLEERQMSQLYTALKNGFATILKFLQEVSMNIKVGFANIL